jgi:hypothetical protein
MAALAVQVKSGINSERVSADIPVAAREFLKVAALVSSATPIVPAYKEATAAKIDNGINPFAPTKTAPIEKSVATRMVVPVESPRNL